MQRGVPTHGRCVLHRLKGVPGVRLLFEAWPAWGAKTFLLPYMRQGAGLLSERYVRESLPSFLIGWCKSPRDPVLWPAVCEDEKRQRGRAQARGPGPPSQPKEGMFDNFHISSKFGDFCPCWSLGRPLWESMWKPLTTEGSLPFLPGNTRALRRHSYFK